VKLCALSMARNVKRDVEDSKKKHIDPNRGTAIMITDIYESKSDVLEVRT
jgi:hypothetical protein